jgi:hypothetical protein
MSEEQAPSEPTLVEKWIKDQQDWQRTWMEYFDSMVKNDEFLVHLGNAMRGSLLAGKAYPGTEPAAAEPKEQTSAPEAAANERFDEILHALHRLQGEIADLKMTVEDLKTVVAGFAKQRITTAPPSRPLPAGAVPSPAAVSSRAASNPATAVPNPAPPSPAPGELGRDEG